MVTIATFGENLKVFTYDGTEFEQTGSHVYKSVLKQLRGGRISCAGNYLVCAIEDSGALPILTNRNSILSVLKRLSHPNASAAAFFNWTNSNLVLGALNGAISISDVKSGKTTVEFNCQESNPIKFLSINSDDDHIAAAPFSNVIHLYSCTTNHLVSTLKFETEEEFSDLQFSPLTRNYLACSTLSGTVLLWDTNTGAAKAQFKSKSLSACAGIAFSSMNSTVMMAVSVSQNFQVFDTREKKPVFEKDMGKPLSCVDNLLTDESRVIMGTVDGYVIALDLRNSSTAGKVYAHKQPVTSLRSLRSSMEKKGKEFRDAQIGTPDEASSVTLDASTSNIFTPLSTHGRQSSMFAGITPSSSRNLPNSLNSPLSAFESFKSDQHAMSTPNPEQSNVLSSNSEYINSFLEQIRTPAQQTDDECESSTLGSSISPISPHHCITESQLTETATTEQSVAIKNALSKARRDENNDLATQLMEALNNVSSELRGLKENINSMATQVEELKTQRDNDRGLLLDMHESILLLPYCVRMENLLLREASEERFDGRH